MNARLKAFRALSAAILRGFLRDRAAVFFAIVFPLMFLVLFGGIFGDSDTPKVDLIEVERDYMRLHVGGRSWLIHQTIKSLEARMNPDQFMRIHRSKMIRRDGIIGLKHHGDGAWSVDLGEGGIHRIGRTYLHDVKAIMQG